MTEEKVAPSWISSKYDNLSSIDSERLNRLASLSGKLDDKDLTDEFDAVEKCASSQSTYHYNASWDNETVSQIKDYATAVGLVSEKCVGIEAPTHIIQINNSNKTITLEY